MKPVEVKAPQIVREIRSEPKLDLKIFRKRSQGKTSGGIILGYMKKLKGKIPLEYMKLLENIYKDITNLEVSERFTLKMWKGKSGVTYIEKPDKVICIRFQKPEPFEQAKEIRVEILKSEINRVLWALNKGNKGVWRETSEIAELVYKMDWKRVFSDRPKHIRLCEIFNYLEYKRIIDYSRAGKVYLKEV